MDCLGFPRGATECLLSMVFVELKSDEEEEAFVRAEASKIIKI